MSENPTSADNQQERIFSQFAQSKNFPWYLTGFVDGEGSFCISIKKHPTAKFGWQIDPSFYLYQHEKNKWILELAAKHFGRGGIHRKSSPYSVFTYAVHGIRNMREVIIPFFQKYPLLVKHETFTLFTSAVELMHAKAHHDWKGFQRIVDIAFALNQMGKGRKWTMERIVERYSSETERRTLLQNAKG